MLVLDSTFVAGGGGGGEVKTDSGLGALEQRRLEGADLALGF